MSYFILTILSSNVNLVLIDPYQSHFPVYLANITSPRIPVGYSWVQSHSESHRPSVNPTILVDSHDPVMRRLQSRSQTYFSTSLSLERGLEIYLLLNLSIIFHHPFSTYAIHSPHHNHPNDCWEPDGSYKIKIRFIAV